jgi:hypothetical protein
MDKKIFRTRKEAERVAADMYAWMTRIIRWTDYHGKQGWVIECRVPSAGRDSVPLYVCQDGYVR